MRKFLFGLFLLCTLFAIKCMTTYDTALVYHKNFHSGTHPLLRFNGYYSDTLGARDVADIRKPVFFYANGAVFSSDTYIPTNELKNKSMKGSWGNYLITADTIQLEKFQLINSNYTRIILKGIISKDQIHWTFRKDHNESFKPVDYTIRFESFSSKPDSSLNFIRTKEKYNQ